jgi:hypothetical protein
MRHAFASALFSPKERKVAMKATRMLRVCTRTAVFLTVGFVVLGNGPAIASWASTDVGSVGMSGTAVENNGVWTVQGAGSDIWSTSDAFQFVSRPASSDRLHLIVRVDDLQNTDPFAKAGLMLRASLNPDAATVILDVRPNGEVEFMQRPSDGAAMAYIGGMFVNTPVWLQLYWVGIGGPTTDVIASVSQDRVNWSVVARSVTFTLPSTGYYAGVAVTSHDTSQLNTAHFEGLSLLPFPWWSDEIGSTGLIGNAAYDANSSNQILTVKGAGGDVWGTADSFEFVHGSPINTMGLVLTYRVVSLDDTNPFAKAGLMFRDSLSPDAMEVILDAKPSGELEFMARMCGGCETTYLGGASITLPGYVSLTRDGSTFTARFGEDPASLTSIGSVVVPMSNPIPGFAVTSHDTSQIAGGVIDLPR